MKNLNTKLLFLPIGMMATLLFALTAFYLVFVSWYVPTEAEKAIKFAMEVNKDNYTSPIPCWVNEMPEEYLQLICDETGRFAYYKNKETVAYDLYMDFRKRNNPSLGGKILKVRVRDSVYYYRCSSEEELKNRSGWLNLFYFNSHLLTWPIWKMYRSLVLAIAGFTVLFQLTGILFARRVRHDFVDLKEEIRQLSEEKPTESKRFRYYETNDTFQAAKQVHEQLAQAEREEIRFFQNASHELRTPLMSICGYAEGMRMKVFDDNAKAAKIVLEEEEKLADLVDQLLLLSVVDVEKLSDKMANVPLKEIINAAVVQAKGIAISQHLKIYEELEADELCLKGEKQQLERTVVNLLSNALRYAKSAIFVRLTKKNGKAVIMVEDDGPGLKNEDLPHIFDRFYKGEKGNFGIGLSFAQEVVKKHGGEIFAENTGHGACSVISEGDGFCSRIQYISAALYKRGE